MIPSGSALMGRYCRFNSVSDVQPPILSGSALMELSRRSNLVSDLQLPILSGSALMELSRRFNSVSDLQLPILSGSALMEQPSRSILMSTVHWLSSSVGSQSVGPFKLFTLSSSSLDASN